MRRVRFAAREALVIALIAVVGWLAVGAIASDHQPGKELCDALETDLDAAVNGSAKLPDIRDADALKLGACSTKKTRRYDVSFPGVDKHDASTVAGRIATDVNFVGGISHAKSAVQSKRTTVSSLPQLGPGAFLVVTKAPERTGAIGQAGADDPGGFPVDVTGDVQLPATAYWQHGDMAFTASGGRLGATVAESKDITTRLAELLNRRPIAKR